MLDDPLKLKLNIRLVAMRCYDDKSEWKSAYLFAEHAERKRKTLSEADKNNIVQIITVRHEEYPLANFTDFQFRRDGDGDDFVATFKISPWIYYSRHPREVWAEWNDLFVIPHTVWLDDGKEYILRIAREELSASR